MRSAPLRLAFLGTPDFATPSLRALIEAGHDVAAVYTQPARPRGRGQAVRPSAVEAFARERGLPVRAPASLRAPEEIESFAALELDAAVVVAFGQILSAPVLDAPRLGAFNLHGSLLPRWRGAAPIQRAIMAGDVETGVQVMRMSLGLDEGAILATARSPIAPDDTAGSLALRLAHTGAALLVDTLNAIARGEAVETPQSGAPVYAPKITTAEARIDWTRSAVEIDRTIRGLSPAPGAWFEAPGERGAVRVKVAAAQPHARPQPEASGAAPGLVLAEPGIVVACGEGALRLLQVQREGRGLQDAETFLRGCKLTPGAKFG